MMMLNDYAPLLLRIMLVALFPFSAVNKMVDWAGAMKQAGTVPFAAFLVALSVMVELVAPICIVTGWHDHVAAFILGGFCAITAILFHQFWRFADFYRFRGGEGMQHFWDFLKNLCLVGGLGLVVLGPRTGPTTEFFAHPLASSVVTGPQAGANAP